MGTSSQPRPNAVESPPEVVSYDAFSSAQSALYRDYLAGARGTASFYDGGAWDLSAIAQAADRAQTGEVRRAVADALAKQQEQRNSPAAREALRLVEPGAVAVVTGQQAGLFGGPLFVLYKALGVVEIARRLEARRGRPAVPVFWVASDDHDFAEIRSATTIDGDGQIFSLRYSPAREPTGTPASQIVLDDDVKRLVAEFRGAQPQRPHVAEVVEALSACYRPGATLAGAFAALLSRYFPELVILDPADAKLKELMAPVMARELQERSPTSRLAAEIGPRLADAGYHQQVPVRDGFLNLFLNAYGQRQALRADERGVELRASRTILPHAEALRRLGDDPAAWSPGVLVRPLAQDAILPTAAYVGGPSEIAYHAQIGPSYSHFGIPRPRLVPRPSLTLVEPAQRRALSAESLSLPALQGEPEALLSQRTRDDYPAVGEAFEATRSSISDAMARVAQALEHADPTLRAAAEASQGRLLHQLETLQQKSLRALKKKDRDRGDRLRRTRDALFPGGGFQERGLAWLGIIARHGPGVIEEIRRRFDPFARGHQVLDL